MAAITPNDVLEAVVRSKAVPNVEAGVALLAASAAAIRDMLLRVRVGSGGIPLPDHGCAMHIGKLMTFVRLPREPSFSSATRLFDATFDEVWLTSLGLRCPRHPVPAGLRRGEFTGREVPSAVLVLFRTSEAVKSAIASIVEAFARLVGEHPSRSGILVWPTLGTLVCERGTLRFDFSDEVTTKTRPGSAARVADFHASQERLVNSRPPSACGSVASTLRSLVRPTSSASQTRPASQHSSVVASTTASPKRSFRAPSPLALQQAMDLAVRVELDRKHREHADSAFDAHDTVFRREVSDVVDLALRKRQQASRIQARHDLDLQIDANRQRRCNERAEFRAETPVVFPFSDQQAQRDKTRRLAEEHLSANKSLLEQRRAVSSSAQRSELAEGAASTARNRSEAAREFLDEVAARRQQRKDLQEAWAAQLAIKHGRP
jgi:hypothetical protein